MAMNKDQVLDYLREHKQEFFDLYGVESIGLFGSILSDNLRSDSDIDLAIEMVATQKNLHNFLAFKRQLEKNFQRPVDLGIESALKPTVKKAISQDMLYV